MTLKYLILAFACILTGAKFGESVKCYHCYESFYKTNQSLGSNLASSDSGDKFVECGSSKELWNVYDCPSKWPTCVVVGGQVIDHFEIIRTCAEANFCAKYEPPPGVTLEYCSECTSPMCNDYPHEPDVPDLPGPLFTFNLNITLKMLKSPIH